MTDADVIEKLAEKLGGYNPLAKQLYTTRQTLWDWKKRGIWKHSRLGVAALAQKHGIKVSSSFTRPRARA